VRPPGRLEIPRRAGSSPTGTGRKSAGSPRQVAIQCITQYAGSSGVKTTEVSRWRRAAVARPALLRYCVTALLRRLAGLGIVAAIGVAGIFFPGLLITANWIVDDK
jgi:hypothetical protein